MNLAPELYDIGFVEGEVPEEMQALLDDVLLRLSDAPDAVDRWAALEVTKELWRMRRWGTDAKQAKLIRNMPSALERRSEDWEEAAHLARVRKQSANMVDVVLGVHKKLRRAG